MLKKVMFFLPTLGGGGAERTVIQLANSFAEQGLQIDLVVCNTQAEKGTLRAEVSEKIQLIDFACGRVANALMPLKAQLVKANYDVVVATQTHSNILCVLAKKLAKVDSKLILREVSTPSKNMHLSGLKKTIFAKMVAWSYANAEHVVCVSEGVKDDFQRYYAYPHANLCTIYNPVIDAAYVKKLAEPVTHAFFQPDLKVVIAVGRLTEAKNFTNLLHAFAQMHRQHANTRLIILGEGELRASLEQLRNQLALNSVVDLPGFDPNPYAYFKYATLFVLSSDWEGLPGVLIQALASKIKVVSTDCPSGPREILADAKFGQLVPCADAAALAQAMQTAIFADPLTIDDAEFNQHIQKFHKHTVLEQYSKIMESTV